MSETNLDIIRRMAECWNAGDMEGMFALYHDDMVVVTGEHWPDGGTVMEGKDAFRQSTREWLDVWQQIEVETDSVEAHGDRVVAHGCWRSTGRMSGVEGTMPIHIVFTLRNGRIARLEWFPDQQRAVAAARGG